jgi:hypothetical protein
MPDVPSPGTLDDRELTAVDIHVRGRVPGIDAERFRKAVEGGVAQGAAFGRDAVKSSRPAAGRTGIKLIQLRRTAAAARPPTCIRLNGRRRAARSSLPR